MIYRKIEKAYLFNDKLNDMLADKDLTLQRLQEDTELCDDKVLRYIRWYKSLPLAEQNIIYLQHLGLRTNRDSASIHSRRSCRCKSHRHITCAFTGGITTT